MKTDILDFYRKEDVDANTLALVVAIATTMLSKYHDASKYLLDIHEDLLTALIENRNIKGQLYDRTEK